MKKTFNSLLFVALTVLPLLTTLRAETDYGYLFFVDAVGLTSKTFIKVNGAAATDDGFVPGEFSGGLAFPPGSASVSLTNDEAQQVDLKVNLPKDTTTFLISYYIKEFDQKEQKEVQKLKAVVLPPVPPAGKNHVYYVVYASQNPSISLSINGTAKELPSIRVEKVTGKNSISLKAKGLSKSLDVEEEGNFLVVIYENAKNELDATLAYMFNG